ncbi:MAG: histidine--tRNA ligase [Alphaproteobacteria bacterium]|jgi:histidyl-tRNA synthetase|nr:MAG: histidine--tRNA ligase [Alphaproteobacteria bacterium]TMK12364.1 MAG: histidine--tRNA ligase [Alphaproteobacteria bacterium]TMK37294.1 MAG: histidine--tRNA ligase [Alphaproteobacteria bacterium]
MPELQPARGTQDLLPETMRRHRRVSDTAREQARLYGFAEIATPVFEFTEVFARPIGEHTDIVAKEMYTFNDRGGEEITLRPENTAGVVRAVLSNGLTQSTPLKFFYSGPMFRYERPQKGRFRQFHQIGVELLGVAQPQADIEVIALGHRILQALGIGNRVTLDINTLGDPESRARYRGALVDYYTQHRAELSEDSQRRLDSNPLRILDSKDPGDIGINGSAPAFGLYLNEPSREFFARVKDGLGLLGIECRENPRLVRGLDYYTHTVFEFVTTDLGAQGTVLAGGRYDGLVEVMGGPAMPGVGWAAGIERLAMLIGEPPALARPIALVPLGEAAERAALKLGEALRDAGLVVELTYSGNLQRRMRRADRIGARAAVLIGDNELAQNAATLRDLDSGAQELVPLGDLPARLKALAG